MSIEIENSGTDHLAALDARVAAARSAADEGALLPALVDLGQAYLQAGNVPKALTQFEEGLALAQSAGSALWEGRLWGYRGICLLRLGNSHFAQIALYKSHNIARELGDKPLLIDALTQLGLLQVDSGNPTKAIAKLEQALGHATALNDQPRLMNLAGRLGTLFLELSSLEKAVEYFALALQAADALDQPQAACSYKLSLGHAYLANGQLETARELLEEALAIAGELDSPAAEISVLTTLLRTHIAGGNSSMALLYGNQAQQLAREHGEAAQEMAVLNLLTAFLAEKGQFKKSLPLLQRALEIANANEEWQWQLTMQERLGFAYYQTDRLPEAQAAYAAAQETALRLQDPAAAAQLYGRLSAVLADQGETVDAIKAARQAVTLAEAQENWSLVGEQQILLAFAYAEQGDLAQAVALCQEAIAVFGKIEDADRLAKAEALLLEVRGLQTPD